MLRFFGERHRPSTGPIRIGSAFGFDDGWVLTDGLLGVRRRIGLPVLKSAAKDNLKSMFWEMGR